ALGERLGVHATAARNDTDLLFKLNGATRTYAPPPNGEDFSASVVYDYRSSGEIKTFAIDRRSALGVGVHDPSFDGGYTSETHSTMVVGTWKDLFGAFAPTVSLACQSVNGDDGLGVFDLGDRERWTQLFAQAAWSATNRLTIRAGGDLDWRGARFVGSKALSQSDQAPSARFVVIDALPRGARDGAFSEADLRAFENLRVIVGLRTDYSSFSRIRTADPRLSLAYKAGAATFTAAAGEYHEVLDPLYYAQGLGKPGVGPEAARQIVAGVQAGEERDIARIEIYDKRYTDLSGFTADERTLVDGGRGRARGVDLFVKRQLWPFFSTRFTYTYVDSRRTDPATGLMARAPFDITNSMTLIGEQALPRGWSVSGAVRYATGKPYAPVVGATFDSTEQVWRPSYGAANSLRLPNARRVDLSLSRLTRPSPSTTLVYFAEIENLFDRDNVYEYTYDADYTRRIAVRSLFNRSFYVGASLSHTKS
ncbi:MAG: TonB-dependent receptor domain-containing protein, partial [Gemmatimonadales bacterium]